MQFSNFQANPPNASTLLRRSPCLTSTTYSPLLLLFRFQDCLLLPSLSTRHNTTWAEESGKCTHFLLLLFCFWFHFNLLPSSPPSLLTLLFSLFFSDLSGSFFYSYFAVLRSIYLLTFSPCCVCVCVAFPKSSSFSSPSNVSAVCTEQRPDQFGSARSLSSGTESRVELSSLYALCAGTLAHKGWPEKKLSELPVMFVVPNSELHQTPTLLSLEQTVRKSAVLCVERPLPRAATLNRV